MRRFSAIIYVIFLLIFVSVGHAYAGIGVRVTGPAAYVGYGDFNDFVEAYNSEILAGSPYSVNKINWVPEFGFEVMYTLTPKLDIGIGAGLMMGSSTLEISVGNENFTEKHKISSYPFTATAYFRPPWPLGPFKPIVYGGGGIYYNKAIFSSAYMGIADDFSYEWTLTKWGYGLHGGVGFEISVLPKLSVDVGVKGRWANFKGFEGTDPISGEDLIIGAGTVEVTYEDPPDSGNYVTINIPEYGPLSPDFVEAQEDMKEAEVNLTGYSIVVGIKVMF